MLGDESEGNYSDIEWLVNNPTNPEQPEAMTAWMVENFGGEDMGVFNSGYYSTTGQECFIFTLHSANGESDDVFVANIKKFIEKVLPFLKPEEDGFVAFVYAAQFSIGAFSIDYRPEDATWWTSKMWYGRPYDRVQMKDLDSAIEFAKVKAALIEG